MLNTYHVKLWLKWKKGYDDLIIINLYQTSLLSISCVVPCSNSSEMKGCVTSELTCYDNRNFKTCPASKGATNGNDSWISKITAGRLPVAESKPIFINLVSMNWICNTVRPWVKGSKLGIHSFRVVLQNNTVSWNCIVWVQNLSKINIKSSW